MRKFSEQYAKNSGTYFCMDKSVTAVVIQGLAAHKDELGSPLCPCRHYDDKPAEVANGFWNCPCVPMRERKECHWCAHARSAAPRRMRARRSSLTRPPRRSMLFLTKDNDFAGEEQAITITEIKEMTAGM